MFMILGGGGGWKPWRWRLKFHEERDRLEFFMKIELLVWIEGPVCTEYNGASFMKNILHEAI